MMDAGKSYEDEFKDESDMIEEGDEGQKDSKSSDFARMLDASLKQGRKRLNVGDKIRGEILVIGKEDIFVSTGTLNDGIVPRRELADAEDNVPQQVGDVLDLYVTQVRGSEIYLSPNPTAKNLASDLEDAFDMMLPVEGRVNEVVNGGFRVQIKGKLAFCPISQMDIARIDQPEEYVGKRFEFRITKFEEGGRNIVVSRRRILEEARDLSVGSFASEHKAGDIVPGRIARLEKFGAFVELAPGLDGMVHVSELSWSRVADPSEVVQVGQQVSVKILKIESQEAPADRPGRGSRLRISLSIKQAGAEPWDNMPGQVRPGQVVEGKVTRCMKFGAFVELAPGIEGLIPMGEMSYTKRVMRAEDVVTEGNRVSVMVKDVDPVSRRISLSLRDADGDPWLLVAQKFPVGAIVTGKVERREAYGLFVKLDEGITGLLPKSKTTDKPEFPFDKLKVGDTVSVQIGELRREERRISLDVPGDPNRDDWKGYVSSASAASSSFGTLADKLKAAMEKKKK